MIKVYETKVIVSIDDATGQAIDVKNLQEWLGRTVNLDIDDTNDASLGVVGVSIDWGSMKEIGGSMIEVR